MDDLISRQQAIDAIHCDITVIGKENAETVARTIGEFVDRIKALPPAQQEGYWIPHEGVDGDIHYECSECGVLWEFNDGTPEDNEAFYCPMCGSYNGGGRK